MWNSCLIPWSAQESLAPPRVLITARRTSQDLDDDEDDGEQPPLVQKGNIIEMRSPLSRLRRRLDFNCSGTSNGQLGIELAGASQQLMSMARVQPTATTTTTESNIVYDNDEQDAFMSESEVEDDDDDNNDSEFEQAMDVLASLAEIITRTVRVVRGNRRRRKK